MIDKILTSEWFIASASLAGGFIVRMIFDRRKVKAENASAEYEAETKAVELYEKYASRIAVELVNLKTKQEELSKQVQELRLENTELKIENRNLKADNSKLQTEITDLYSKLKELTVQVSKPKTSKPSKQ